jgi:phosphate transport system permease protein
MSTDIEVRAAPEATRLPAEQSLVEEDMPRPLSAKSFDDHASLIGSFLASLALVWLIYEKLLAWSGGVGFIICCWLMFLVMYAGVTAIANPRTAVTDRLMSAIMHSGAALVGFVLASIVVYVFVKGWPALHHSNFYTHDMAGVRPTAPLSQGGIAHALVGTAIQVGIATAISLPLGVGTAIYLSEVGGRIANTVRTVVEAMTALPDILAGLFIYTVLIIGLHWERTGLTVGLALAVTMTPIIARSAEVVLRVVPGGLREAGLALGASAWQTVWHVVLPTARAGLATSLILGVARVAGETAPLLIVSGLTSYFNADPLTNPMNSLPLFIFGAIRSGEPNYIARGYGGAAVLLTFVLVLFAATRFLARNRVAAAPRPRASVVEA